MTVTSARLHIRNPSTHLAAAQCLVSNRCILVVNQWLLILIVIPDLRRIRLLFFSHSFASSVHHCLMLVLLFILVLLSAILEDYIVTCGGKLWILYEFT